MKIELQVVSPLPFILKAKAPDGVIIDHPPIIERRSLGHIDWVKITISWVGSVPIGVLIHYLIKNLENRSAKIKSNNEFIDFTPEVIEKILKRESKKSDTDK